MRDEVFPHLKDMAGADPTFGRYMNDAMLMIQKPSLLVKALELIDDLPLDKGDTKGDLYEYPPQQAHHRRHQRPVPHAAPHHPAHGRPA